MKTFCIRVTKVATFNLIAIPLAFASATLPLDCPKEIQTTQNLTSPHAKWEIIVGEPHHFLNGISFYSGNPKEFASLKPDLISNKEAKWSFNENEPIYMVCQYNQTVVQLTQALPTKVKYCEVLFDQTVRVGNGFIPQKVECTGN